MATTVATLRRSLNNILAIQHLVFPFQGWMGPLLDFFTKDGSTTEALTVWVSLITVYSVAANTARNQSLRKVATLKIWYTTFFVAIAIIVHRDTWIVCGLLLEGIVSGLFESWTFGRYLSTLVDERSRGARQMTLLAFIVTGLPSIPRLLSLLGLPTHLSLRIEPDIITHALVIVMNGLVNEGLSSVHPSTFPPLSIYKMPNGRNVLLKGPLATLSFGPNLTTRTLRKITILNQMCLWLVVVLVWGTIVGLMNDIKLFLFSHVWHKNSFSQALFSVRQMQAVVSQGLNLLLLGRTKDFRSLLADIYAQTHFLIVLRKLVDFLLSIYFWTFSFLVVGYAFTLVEWIFARIQELSNTLHRV